jgi:hypothetical protein
MGLRLNFRPLGTRNLVRLVTCNRDETIASSKWALSGPVSARFKAWGGCPAFVIQRRTAEAGAPPFESPGCVQRRVTRLRIGAISGKTAGEPLLEHLDPSGWAGDPRFGQARLTSEGG